MISAEYTITDLNKRIYNFAFDYLKKKYVKVSSKNITTGVVTNCTYGVHYVVVDKTIELLQSVGAVGDVLRIVRETSTSEQIVSWNDASILKARDMSLSQIQQLHILEEYGEYISTYSLSLNINELYDAKNTRIINLLNPQTATDAVNKGFMDSAISSAIDSAVGTLTSAQASATASQASATASQASAILAQSWAVGSSGDRPEGSSKYWAELAHSITNGDLWLKKDGSRPLDLTYYPTSPQEIATKEYVDKQLSPIADLPPASLFIRSDTAIDFIKPATDVVVPFSLVSTTPTTKNFTYTYPVGGYVPANGSYSMEMYFENLDITTTYTIKVELKVNSISILSKTTTFKPPSSSYNIQMFFSSLNITADLPYNLGDNGVITLTLSKDKIPTTTIDLVTRVATSKYTVFNRLNYLIKTTISEYTNVKTYGVVGNGVVDDTLKLQNAIDSVPAGTTLVFPKGTYKVTSPIKIRSGLRYIGVGDAIIYGYGCDCFKIDGTQFWNMEYLTFMTNGKYDALGGLSSSAYAANFTVRNCTFRNELRYGISGNVILAHISDNEFGYFGNGFITSGLYFIGVDGGDTTNANIINRNKFYTGDYGIISATGYAITIINNTFEYIKNTAIKLNGMFCANINNNYFEKITTNGNVPIIEYNSYGTIVPQGIYAGTVSGNYFTKSTGLPTFIYGGSWANALTYIGNIYVNFTSATDIGTSSSVSIGNKALNSSMTGSINSLGWELAPKISTRGFSQSPWLIGWLPSNPQGWSKSGGGNPAWSQSTDTGYLGNTIVGVTTAGGYSNFYINLPVNYFKGKKIQIKAVAMCTQAGYAYLGYNTTEAIPTALTPAGDTTRLSTSISEVSGVISVPLNATYLNVGVGTGGVASTIRILAFDVWVVNGDIEPMLSY